MLIVIRSRMPFARFDFDALSDEKIPPPHNRSEGFTPGIGRLLPTPGYECDRTITGCLRGVQPRLGSALKECARPQQINPLSAWRDGL
jgi:hypothetical protein